MLDDGADRHRITKGNLESIFTVGHAISVVA